MVRNGAPTEPSEWSDPVVVTCRTVTTLPFVDLSSGGEESTDGDPPSGELGAGGSGSLLLHLRRVRLHVPPVHEEPLEQVAPPHVDDAGQDEHRRHEVPEG